MASAVIVIGAVEGVRREIEKHLGERAELLIVRLAQKGGFRLEPHPQSAVQMVEAVADRADNYGRVLVIELPYAACPEQLAGTVRALEELGATVLRPAPASAPWPARPKALDERFRHALRNAILAAVDEWLPGGLPEESVVDAIARARGDFSETLEIPVDVVLETRLTGDFWYRAFRALDELCLTERQGEAQNKRDTLQRLLAKHVAFKGDIQGRRHGRLRDSRWEEGRVARTRPPAGGTADGNRKHLLDHNRRHACIVSLLHWPNRQTCVRTLHLTVRVFTNGIEPDNPDAEIWRFIGLDKFEKLLKGEPYFRRADLFDDETEGLPPEEYERVLNLSRYDLRDIQERSAAIGFIAQMRQSYYLNCWYLFDEEKAALWKRFAMGGVAVRSTYRRLKAVIEPLIGDEPTLGLVRYGSGHVDRWNLEVFISTKKKEYEHEREIRAMLTMRDPHESANRNIDIENRFHDRPIYDTPNPKGINRPVNLNVLVAELVVSPYADVAAFSVVTKMVQDAGYTFPVRASELMRFATLLP
jgi:hypothetical protein